MSFARKASSEGVQIPGEKRDPVTTEESSSPEDANEYPDGGTRAWLVVLGAMCSTFSTFGLVNSWGVFQAYYEINTLKDSNPSSIAWIGSIQYSLVTLPGIITGRLFDLGHFKLPYFVASITLVVSTLLVAECHKYWHFLLCQGLATGFACGVVFGPTMGVIGHWFKRRRGLALGLTAVGSSIGGTIFPIAAKRLIVQIGFKWAVRVLAFILIFTLSVANIALKRRLPPVNKAGGLFNLKAFKSAPYSVYSISGFFTFLGLYTVLTYIDVSATSVGIDPEFSFYLISIANGASGVGRYLTGVLTDRLGSINVMAPMTLVAAVLTYAWPFAITKGENVAIAVIYGFTSGAYISTFLGPVFALGDVEDIGRRTGMMLTISAIGALVGPPISGAINHATNGFKATGYYAGSTIVVAVLLMGLTKYLALGSLRGNF